MAAAGLIDFRWAWDEAAFHAVNGLGVSWLDALWVLASSKVFGFAVLAAMAVALVVALRRGSLVPLVQLGVAVGLSDALGARVLKPLIGRMRPSYALSSELVRVLAPAADVGSMPSIHAANAFAAATVVTLVRPRFGLVAMPLAVLVAVSRVGVGVHWPSDVLAGAVVGVLVGVGVVLVTRRVLKRRAAAVSE